MGKDKDKKKKKVKKPRIRALALGIFRQDDYIFVSEGYDAALEKIFYRPIGGAIEFGEHGNAAVWREVYEELGLSIEVRGFLGALENIFTYESHPGHEIVLLYATHFVDEACNALSYVAEGHDDNSALYTARWMPIDFFRNGGAPLYPDGLIALLDKPV